MPPNISDGYIMLRPRQDWPDPDRSREDLMAAIQAEAELQPGSNYEFSQPIADRLTDEQWKKAVVATEAPKEMITAADHKVNPLKPDGISDKDLTPEQQQQLHRTREVVLEPAREGPALNFAFALPVKTIEPT